MDATESNRLLIERLYEAFDQGDGDTMAACYEPTGTFRDPVFGELTGEQAGTMWRMFTSRPGDLRVELAEHDTTGDGGSARWIARYTFEPTGRWVENDIRATFRFSEGQIVEHTDRFSFWTWARQALGAPGLILGWTPLLPLILRRKVRRDLDRFARGEPVDL